MNVETFFNHLIYVRTEMKVMFLKLTTRIIMIMFVDIFRYERLLRRARTEDLTEVSGIGCLYQSGFDRLGRPIIVFCGKWFPAHELDLEKV